MIRFLKQAAKEKNVDLESWEFGLRRAVLAAGANLLQDMLEGLGSGRQDEPVICGCGTRMESRGRKEKRIKTILGDIQIKRSIFVCPDCGKSRIPADEILGVVKTGFSPGVKRMMARSGQRDAFKEARDDLKTLAELEVTAKDVERVAEGIGQEIETWQEMERADLQEGALKSETQDSVPVL